MKDSLRTEHLELRFTDSEDSTVSFEVYVLNTSEKIGDIHLYSDGAIQPILPIKYFLEGYSCVAEYATNQGLLPHLWVD